jgi:hypothetical protein
MNLYQNYIESNRFLQPSAVPPSCLFGYAGSTECACCYGSSTFDIPTLEVYYAGYLNCPYCRRYANENE